MIEVGSRRRSQPAPPRVIFEALTQPDRAGARPWLTLLHDEIPPRVAESDEPALVVWTSIWLTRPDAVVRFDLPPGHSGTDLRWTLLVDAPVPSDALLGHLRKRLAQLINADLRYSSGSSAGTAQRSPCDNKVAGRPGCRHDGQRGGVRVDGGVRASSCRL